MAWHALPPGPSGRDAQLAGSPDQSLTNNTPVVIQRVSDCQRPDHVCRLWKAARVAPDNFADLISRYSEFAAHDRAQEGIDERFVILIGEGVDPDQAVNANLEPCLLAELSAGRSYRRFTLLDPPARRANLARPVRRPREHDVSAIVKHNANGDGYRLRAHRPKLLREHEPPRDACHRERAIPRSGGHAGRTVRSRAEAAWCRGSGRLPSLPPSSSARRCSRW